MQVKVLQGGEINNRARKIRKPVAAEVEVAKLLHTAELRGGGEEGGEEGRV